MKKILITTDFSDSSKHTIEFVVDFLKDLETPSHIVLLNTYIVRETDASHVIELNDELKRISRTQLEKERDEILPKIFSTKISIEIASHMGSLNNVVLQFLKKERFDFVAMGKRNGKHVENMSSMLKKQKCPLLITY